MSWQLPSLACNLTCSQKRSAAIKRNQIICCSCVRTEHQREFYKTPPFLASAPVILTPAPCPILVFWSLLVYCTARSPTSLGSLQKRHRVVQRKCDWSWYCYIFCRAWRAPSGVKLILLYTEIYCWSLSFLKPAGKARHFLTSVCSTLHLSCIAVSTIGGVKNCSVSFFLLFLLLLLLFLQSVEVQDALSR